MKVENVKTANKIMRYTFEEEFRLDHPETVGETDTHFDLDNYKDWLEAQLIEARKQLALYNVIEQSEQLPCPHCGQLEPCAGNSPETCYHPKVC